MTSFTFRADIKLTTQSSNKSIKWIQLSYFLFKDQYFVFFHPSLTLIINFSHFFSCLNLSHVLVKLFPCKIPFISFYCKIYVFPDLMCLPVFLFLSSLSHFSFEHQSPAHKHHLKPGLTFSFLLHCENKFPHTEISFSSHFYHGILFTWTFFNLFSLCIISDLFLFLFQWYSITHLISLASGLCVEHCRVLGDNSYYQ